MSKKLIVDKIVFLDIDSTSSIKTWLDFELLKFVVYL